MDRMTTEEAKLVEDLKTVAKALNIVARRAYDMGIKLEYSAYSIAAYGEGAQFEFTLSRDVREFEVTIKREGENKVLL